MKKISLLLSALCMAFVGHTQSVKYVPFVDDFNESNGDSTLFIVGKGTFSNSTVINADLYIVGLYTEPDIVIACLSYNGDTWKYPDIYTIEVKDTNDTIIYERENSFFSPGDHRKLFIMLYEKSLLKKGNKLYFYGKGNIYKSSDYSFSIIVEITQDVQDIFDTFFN